MQDVPTSDACHFFDIWGQATKLSACVSKYMQNKNILKKSFSEIAHCVWKAAVNTHISFILYICGNHSGYTNCFITGICKRGLLKIRLLRVLFCFQSSFIKILSLSTKEFIREKFAQYTFFNPHKNRMFYINLSFSKMHNYKDWTHTSVS